MLSSTINGYEGTGRSLSLKLLASLKEKGNLEEVKLSTPIRYGSDDNIESWLMKLLLLNTDTINKLNNSLTVPDKSKLYYVNKDTLFSSHKKSEAFLRQIYYILVSSHYKNTPNDIQLLSDNPTHGLFVLTNDFKANKVGVEDVDIYCVIQ